MSRAVAVGRKTKPSFVVFWTDPSCGGVFYLTHRGVEVTSPNYPDLHPPDITCQYVFKVSKLVNFATLCTLCQLHLKGTVNEQCLRNIIAIFWHSFVGNERTAMSEEREYISWIVLFLFHYKFISKTNSENSSKDTNLLSDAYTLMHCGNARWFKKYYWCL